MTIKQVTLRSGRGTAAILLLAACGMIPAALADTQPSYDRRIEEAAIRMLQPKLGDIRGSLDVAADGHMFAPPGRPLADSSEADAPPALPRGRSQGSFIHF